MLLSESTFGKTYFMSTKFKFRDNDELYFVTFTVVYQLDVFIRNEYKEIFLDSLKYCITNKGLEVCGWCITTSHVHLIIGSNKEKLPDIVRDLKKFTSLKIIQAIKNSKIESRRDWLLWMMQRAGSKNGHNNKFQF